MNGQMVTTHHAPKLKCALDRVCTLCDAMIVKMPVTKLPYMILFLVIIVTLLATSIRDMLI